ncbi:MAG TPA: hypothetical protein DCY51_00880 [Bacteroidetes bacterium]|nr:hypothetical protein [Bacteroidota bacterium]
MRKYLVLVLFLYRLLGFAQNYVDVLHSEYTATPQNTFDSSNQTTDLQKININITTPIKLKNGNAILTGLVYDRVNTSFDPGEKMTPVSSFILKMGMNIKHSDKWSTTFLLLPKLASTFTATTSSEDFQFGGLVLAKKKKTENLSYKIGAYMNGDQFGPFLVPLFGFYYKKKKLEMDVIVPSYAKINYSLSPKFTAGVNWRATVKSYNLQGPMVNLPAVVKRPFYMHHLSNEIAAHVGYEPIKGVIVRGMAGVSLGRSFRVYENDDKIDFGLSLFRFGDDRVPLNTDFANGLFYRAELAYRVYLD